MPSPKTRARRLLPPMANDYWRQNVASLSSVVCVGVLLAVRVIGGDGPDFSGKQQEWASELLVTIGFGGWVSFCAINCWLTHRTFARMGSAELREQGSAAARHTERWWHSFLGTTDSTGWTVYAATTATVLVLILARNEYIRDDPAYAFFGLGAAAGSWLLMAYAFALTYMRAHSVGEGLEFPFEGDAEFGDFLSHSVFVSTFLGPQAKVRSRAIQSTMRTHALLAFMFNAVVVAMTVSLLFGTLSS